MLALPTPRASPKYPAVPLSPSLSLSLSLAGQAIAEGKIIILAYLHAALVLAVQLTDSLGWTDYDSASDCCSNSCSDSPTHLPSPSLCLLLLACELSLAWFILKLQANNFEIEATFLKLLKQSAESHRPTVCLSVLLSPCLSLSCSVSPCPFECLREPAEYHLGCCTNRVTVKCPFQTFPTLLLFGKLSSGFLRLVAVVI